MKKSTTYHAYMAFIFCAFLATSQLACINCKKPQEDLGYADKLTTNPTPTPPPATSTVDAAIKDLEKKVVGNPHPDPRLKKIYDVITFLPPRQFTKNLDGTKSRINSEKNGWELFDKILTTTLTDPEIMAWLIDQGLLDPNERSQAGELPLEKAWTTMMSPERPLYRPFLRHIVQTLIDYHATLTPEKSAELLAQLIASELEKNSPFYEEDASKAEKAIIDFLQKQRGALTPQQAAGLLQKLIEDNILPPKSKAYLIDLLAAYKPVAQDSEKPNINRLFRQALQGKQGIQVYKALLALGASPNVQIITTADNKMPLLHYTTSLGMEGVELFKALVANSRTNINVTNDKGQTVAMARAYIDNSTLSVQALLERSDLDINKIQSQEASIKGHTLLDIVVANCMQVSGGNHNQQKWLKTLQEMSLHPNFFVTPENIRRAEKKSKKLDKIANSVERKLAKTIADEAINLLKKFKNPI